MPTSTTANHSPLLVATFDTRAQAERAIDALRQAGFPDDRIGMAIRDCQDQLADLLDKRGGERAVQGLAAGAAVGGALGATIALLVPGFGPVVAFGILTIALESASLGAAAGGLIGGLTGLGASPKDAHFCEKAFRDGHPIVVVRANGRSAEAKKMLRGLGAFDRRARACR